MNSYMFNDQGTQDNHTDRNIKMDCTSKWFEVVGPIIGRNVGEYINNIQKTETGSSYKYGNSIYKMKIQSGLYGNIKAKPYFLKEQYEKTMTEISNTKNSDGLSGQDKMEMNLTKIDEGIIALTDINVRNCIQRIQKEIDVPITEEEIQYYRDNQYPSALQVELVRLYYANYFNNYRDLKLVNRREYIILMLLLKKKLLIEAGYDKDSNEFTDCILPYILTGNLEESVNTRLIRNNKFISKRTK